MEKIDIKGEIANKLEPRTNEDTRVKQGSSIDPAWFSLVDLRLTLSCIFYALEVMLNI